MDCKWVSVAEKLPNDGTYLVCEKVFNKYMISIYRFCKDGNKVDEYDLKNKKNVFIITTANTVTMLLII